MNAENTSSMEHVSMNGEKTSLTDHVSRPNTVENGELQYISKYLVQFVPDAKSQKVVRILGARVLRSDECAAVLKECEEKKRRRKKRKGKEEITEKTKEKKERRTKEKEGSSSREKRSCCKEKAKAAVATAEKKATAEANKATAAMERTEKLVRGNKLNRKRQASFYATRTKCPRLDTDADVPCSSHTITTPDENENVCSIIYVFWYIKKMKKMTS